MASPHFSFDAALKRLFDMVVSAAGLVLLLPLFVTIALIIKSHDGGDVLYRAVRVGRFGKVFHLFKFRTMQPGAAQQGPALTSHGDPRITPPGVWLRRTKLDELPELLNVLAGQMSLVGPRPEDPRYVQLYSADQRRILQVRPGITSVASLEYRHEEEVLARPDWDAVYRQEIMPAKLALDLEYLAHRTVWTDINLVIRTIFVMPKITGFTPPAVIRAIDFSATALSRVRNRQLLLLDTLIFLATPTMALALRLDIIPWRPARATVNSHLQSLLLVTLAFFVIKLAVFYFAGLYQRYWRYAGIDELIQIMLAGFLLLFSQSLLFFGVLLPAGLIPLFPRSIPVLDVLLTLFFFSAIRFVIPVAERLRQRAHNHHHSMRVIVAGAGRAGRSLVRAMQSNPQLQMYPVAFVDDDPHKRGLDISGVRVRGNVQQIPHLARQMRAYKVIVAMPDVPAKTFERIASICKDAGIQAQNYRGVRELLNEERSQVAEH